jgi:phi13 family phage major tail protein
MATIGLKDFFLAPCTENEDAPETYGAPFRLAKAITAKLTTNVAEAILYGDDAVDTTIREFTDGELEFNGTDISDENEAILLGRYVDENGVLVSGDTDEPPYFAAGFRAKKPGGKYRYVWLLKIKFGIPDEDYQTKADSIEFKTPTIKGKFIKRFDNNWKFDKTMLPTDELASEWFTEVYEPVTEPAGSGQQ